MAKKKSKPVVEEPEEVEAVEAVEEVKPEEAPIEVKPKFKNNGEAIKINLGTRNVSNWITVKAGETVTIPEKIALANNLEKVE